MTEGFWRIREARPEDEAAVTAMYEGAIALLRACGIDQWQMGGPSRESFRRDLAQGDSYLLELLTEGAWVPCGTMFLHAGEEPTYQDIEGAWASAEPYLVIHRVALAPLARGSKLASAFFYYAREKAEAWGFGQIRIDTHEDNLAMQHLLEKNGFTRRGVIWLDETSREPRYKRYAYDVDLATLAEAQALWPWREKER